MRPCRRVLLLTDSVCSMRGCLCGGGPNDSVNDEYMEVYITGIWVWNIWKYNEDSIGNMGDMWGRSPTHSGAAYTTLCTQLHRDGVALFEYSKYRKHGKHNKYRKYGKHSKIWDRFEV